MGGRGRSRAVGHVQQRKDVERVSHGIHEGAVVTVAGIAGVLGRPAQLFALFVGEVNAC